MQKRKAIVIYGPTASGKSALAIELAQEKKGIIVNSDSLQVYKELKILTACPDEEDLTKARHFLYNVLDGDDNCTTVRYLEMLKELLESESDFPIIVGGTGLYVKALMQGLAEMPDIPDDVRKLARTMPITEVQAYVSENDPDFIHKDEQRLRRAFEIFKASGKTYSYWQQQPLKKYLDLDIELVTTAPDREILYDRCNKRFEIMMKMGAIEEVQNLLKMGYKSDTTIMKAIGVDEIKKYLNNEITLDDAIKTASTRTRQYAKRQLTWMRTQL